MILIAREVNDDKPNLVINKVRQAVKETGKKRPVIACFGLAFKPDIDDLRESPALMITEKIARERLGDIIAVEPNIEIQAKSLSRLGVALVSTDEAISKVDIIVLLVNHREFRDKITKNIDCKRIIDTVGLLEKNQPLKY